jgi:hypothetical protein
VSSPKYIRSRRPTAYREEGEVRDAREETNWIFALFARFALLRD